MTGPEGSARTHAKKRLAMVVAGGIAGVAASFSAFLREYQTVGR